ncbi:hypothetical protein [Parasphingorhabdus cellanae]|uniref:hypothetical protein n=1 Tax=Parasphingorhabdus cellanae TaxID=2806553 RepID=UPI001FB071EE|nr:hypothetical protein [Parasphingorhabdus cellanae]
MVHNLAGLRRGLNGGSWAKLLVSDTKGGVAAAVGGGAGAADDAAEEDPGDAADDDTGEVAGGSEWPGWSGVADSGACGPSDREAGAAPGKGCWVGGGVLTGSGGAAS